MKTQMSFQNACVCDANADQKLPRYCRVHITWRNILVTTNKIVASADRPYVKTPEGKEGEKGKEKRQKSGKSGSEKYLLLTEFEVRTVSYRPSFFPLQFMAQARSARAINRRGKTWIRNLRYGPRSRG